MYASGIKKSDIANELGVTRPAIGNWARKDRWDEKLLGIVARAEEALNNKTGDQVAATLNKLRSQMASRIVELESLCLPGNNPGTRLQAIKLWMELAGIKRAMPNPTDPTTPKSLQLIEDLLHPDPEVLHDQKENREEGGEA